MSNAAENEFLPQDSTPKASNPPGTDRLEVLLATFMRDQDARFELLGKRVACMRFMSQLLLTEWNRRKEQSFARKRSSKNDVGDCASATPQWTLRRTSHGTLNSANSHVMFFVLEQMHFSILLLYCFLVYAA
jgi:hypothetical protein